MPVIELEELEVPAEGSNRQLRHFNVTLVRKQVRAIVNSLKAHRAQQAEHVNAMRDAGSSPATIGLERAMLRSFSNHAKQQCNGPAPLTIPPIYAFPMVCLLLESAMRIGEPLVHARWVDVDREHSILHLRGGKTGQRKVPLSPNALRLLEEMKDADVEYAPDKRIFRTTYEAIKKAWSQSCKKADITDVRLQDLRNTSPTRYALQFNGNTRRTEAKTIQYR